MRTTLARALGATLLLGTSSFAFAQEAQIVLPGAPGQQSRVIGAEEALQLSDTSYAPGDVRFMQDMMVHHAQAVEMAGLVEGRTNNEDIVAIAGRIDASQADEIEFMRDWLVARNQPAKAAAATTAAASFHRGAALRVIMLGP